MLLGMLIELLGMLSTESSLLCTDLQKTRKKRSPCSFSVVSSPFPQSPFKSKLELYPNEVVIWSNVMCR